MIILVLKDKKVIRIVSLDSSSGKEKSFTKIPATDRPEAYRERCKIWTGRNISNSSKLVDIILRKFSHRLNQQKSVKFVHKRENWREGKKGEDGWERYKIICHSAGQNATNFAYKGALCLKIFYGIIFSL